MPIPTPSEKEAKETFISRCMTSLKDEKRPNDQKLGICFSTWERAKKKKKAQGSTEPPVWEDVEKNGFTLLG
jgi:hypothetical protein